MKDTRRRILQTQDPFLDAPAEIDYTRSRMGLFDFLRDPASLWKADPGVKLEFDLEEGSCCGVRLGTRAASFSKLGPPSNPKPTKKQTYLWKDLGFEACTYEGMLDYLCVTFNALEYNPVKPYPGAVLRGGKALDLGPASTVEDVVRILGEPFAVYADDEDDEVTRTLYYATRTQEVEIEFLKAGMLHAIAVYTDPSMADPKTRQKLNCTKPWPPA